MTEQKPTENLVTKELSPDELNSVVGGIDKTPPKTKNPTPLTKPGTLSFDIEQ